jgi:hypothetical protein
MTRWKLVLTVVGLLVALAGGVAVGAMFADRSPKSAAGTTFPETTSVPSTGVPADTSATSKAVTTGSTPAASAPSGECEFPPGETWVGGPSSSVVDLGEANGVSVQGVVYPRPDYEGDPWTQWGQGLVIDDGRFLSAIGDHLGPDGNSYLYEFDPGTGELSMIGDVLSYVDHQPGSWGYGKIHGQIVAGSCGEVYFATYWGSNQDIRFDGSYNGDVLFRMDPYQRTITLLGPPVERHGIPSLAGTPDGTLVYGEAIDPILEVDDIDQGPFFAYDTRAGAVIFESDPTPHIGFRNVAVDADGKAYYSIGASQLQVYDPATNTTSTHPSTLPGEWLRASTTPGPDGTIFGVTDDEAAFFVMDPSGAIEPLGTARGYTTSLAIHPDGDRFFYVPDAHGDAWETGAPLISVDGATGEESVVVELNPLVEEGLGVRLGGTYSVSIHPDGDVMYIGMNAGPLGAEDGFGDIVLLVVHLP